MVQFLAQFVAELGTGSSLFFLHMSSLIGVVLPETMWKLMSQVSASGSGRCVPVSSSIAISSARVALTALSGSYWAASGQVPRWPGGSASRGCHWRWWHRGRCAQAVRRGGWH